MDDTATNTTTCVEIDGRPFILHRDRDAGEVMAAIEAAAALPDPTFVHLGSGDELTSVLISARSRVIVTVRHDSADHAIAPDPAMYLPTEEWDL